MKTSAMLCCGLCLAFSALADPYVISKQQARRVADQTPADPQNSTPPASMPFRSRLAAPPAQAEPAASAAPMDPALAATLQNIGNLRADIAAFNAVTNAAPEATQKTSLLNNLSAAAQGTKPAAETIKQLGDHLIAATCGKKMPPPQQTTLARDIHAVFNSSHLTAAQQKLMFDDVQKTLIAAGSLPADVGAVVTDLKTVATETK